MSNCEVCGEPMPEGETMFKFHGCSGPCPKPPLPKPKDTITAFAAWHPVKGFDEHHYEGPIAFADLDDEGGVIEVVKDLNQTEGTTEWRAVKVEIKRVA